MLKTVEFFMVKNPMSINLELSLDEIMIKMNATGVSHLLVKNKEGQLLGVVSKADILTNLKTIIDNSSGKTYSALSKKSITAKNLMSAELITVKPEDTLDYAVELLLQKEFHCLPVVSDGKAVGIITFYDLLKGYYQQYG